MAGRVKVAGVVLAAASVLASGCASSTRIVRRQFSQSYKCPYDAVLVEESGYRPASATREYMARGCGQEVYYDCHRIDLLEIHCTRVKYRPLY